MRKDDELDQVRASSSIARKAEGASCTALLIPRPPKLTGREACDQAGSLSPKPMLTMSPTQKLVILLQYRREKAWGGPEAVQKLQNIKRVAKKENSIMGSEVPKPLSHGLQQPELPPQNG